MITMMVIIYIYIYIVMITMITTIAINLNCDNYDDSYRVPPSMSRFVHKIVYLRI